MGSGEMKPTSPQATLDLQWKGKVLAHLSAMTAAGFALTPDRRKHKPAS